MSGHTLDIAGAIERQLHAQNDPEGHIERDAYTFHPSHLAYCKRQCTLSKLGLKSPDTRLLGIFKVGTLIHEWLEETVVPDLAGDVKAETPVRTIWNVQQTHDIDNGITVTGTCDLYDPVDDVVIDFKSRNGWYNFDPPVERHLNQLYIYMDAIGAEYGQVAYIAKGDMEVRTWPEDGYLTIDDERLADIKAQAVTIAQWLETVDDIDAVTPVDVPFGPCSCFVCSQDNSDVHPDLAGDDDT